MKKRPPRRISRYLAFRAAHPALFDTETDGLAIVFDPQEISEIEREVGRKLAARGLPEQWATVGVHYQDPYFIVLRDAVRFPDGSRGVHHRIVRLRGEPSGVAALALHEGKIILLRHFRHPTRQWHWEIPRGAIEPGATPEEALAAEIAEELGGRMTRAQRLGTVHGSSSLVAHAVMLFYVELDKVGEPARSEGIVEIRPVTVAAFEAMVRESMITDAFGISAFVHARLRGLV